MLTGLVASSSTRQPDGELQTPFRMVCLDAAFVAFHRSPGDRQAQPGTFRLTPGGAVEGLEDLFQFIIGDMDQDRLECKPGRLRASRPF